MQSALGALSTYDLRHRFSVTETSVDPKDVYAEAPTPGGAHPKVALFYAPEVRPESTVMFADLEDGWWTLVNAIASRCDGTHLQLRVTGRSAEFPLRGFEVWQGRTSRRAVSCSLDDRGKWLFEQRGQPMSFEVKEDYAKRRISERLLPARVFDYAKALGWDLADSGFWRSLGPGTLLREILTQA